MVVSAAVPAFALNQSTIINSNDNVNQGNVQLSKQWAKATTTTNQGVNRPQASTNQLAVGSVQVGVTSQDNSQTSTSGNFIGQSSTQSANNIHVSSRTTTTSQTAVCAVFAAC
ncbi:hypothetical protein Ngar_c30270 [Candidatus Nitrososphaera gargensis Ga9.2]|uniref:Uncharacterized protein n=2 Tax=Candidatus Nitrososphaera gargensis TaxID=497727 RepID=K0IKS2_NITGG|nr:hypothetical protein Ngar_c30270 [Candidatus Nitrososphaera gargensis Ga9.2]